jgi:hypothetical protein
VNGGEGRGLEVRGRRIGGNCRVVEALERCREDVVGLDLNVRYSKQGISKHNELDGGEALHANTCLRQQSDKSKTKKGRTKTKMVRKFKNQE